VLRAVRLYKQWGDIGLNPPECVDEAMRDVGRAYNLVLKEDEGHLFVKFVTLFADLISLR